MLSHVSFFALLALACPPVILRSNATKDPVFCGTALLSTGFFVATLLRMTAGLPPLKGEVPAEQAEGFTGSSTSSLTPQSRFACLPQA